MNDRLNYQKYIHLVDDDRVVCHSLTKILNKHGFHVEVFISAEEYLDKVVDGYDGYLLLDYKMSGMTGLELQDALLEKNVNPKIIFITAMGEQIEQRALANGALRVFDKPFDLNELIKIL
jgi:FixJ family two-component response regulator